MNVLIFLGFACTYAVSFLYAHWRGYKSGFKAGRSLIERE